VEFAASKGATTVLLQGGHNPALPLDYYITLVRETRARFPQITPHFFTASEIRTMAQVSSLTVEDVLDRLWDAGQRTILGGGAEVLSERARTRTEPKKGCPDAGRTRPFHRLRPLVLQARQPPAREMDQALPGPDPVSPDAPRLPPLPG